MTGTSKNAGDDLRIPRRGRSLQADGQQEIRPLAEWRDIDAYVLLGDPGAGKSVSLRAEAQASGGLYLSARDFITLGVDPEDAGRTLFLDGLDEMRAGASNGRMPLDDIRSRLKALGCPRFRLSCREHDWRAQTDLPALNLVARGGWVQELHLEPLSRDEQQQLLEARSGKVPDAEAFLQRADELGLTALFGNPLLLDLTVRAVADQGGWPASRREIYDLACRDLATERSPGHLDVKPLQPGAVDQLLDDAGLLCAVLLLSGKASLTTMLQGSVALVAWHTLPRDLSLGDARAALASKIFATMAGESAPRHRSIAEYLAARAIARRLQQGLPLGRVLALMQGADGHIVEPLRGLLGWLAVHDARDRQQLIRLDPLGVVLDGDVAAYTVSDKQVLLEALRDEARRNPEFRSGRWVSHPFAPLAAPDMADALAQVLSDHSVDASHQALVDCVFDALRQGVPMPALRTHLEAWVEDADAWFRNRLGALEAWKHSVGFDAGKAREWLDRLHAGKLKDRDARLAGDLLLDLYPSHLGPDEVLNYWLKQGEVSANTVVPRFWRSGLIEQSRPHDFAVLANAWLRLQPKAREPHYDTDWLRLRSGILASALEHSGDHQSDECVYAWLGIGMDKHRFSKLDHDAGGARVAYWLSERPARIKALVTLGWHAAQPDAKTGRRFFWEAEQRLHGARRPQDWLPWLLQQAADAPNEELARYCFAEVARAAIDPPSDVEVPTMDQIDGWVEAHSARWPQAREWLVAEWSSRLEDNWRADDYRRRREQDAKAIVNQDARRKAIASHLDALLAGKAAAHVMHEFVYAYDARFYDVRGDTPEQRVQDFLGSDEATARAAIAGLVYVLERNDLPSADEVFRLDARGRYPSLRPVALLAARLAHEQDPGVTEAWPEPLLATLVACWLTYGMDETPGWYKQVVESQPSVVAPLLVRHALPRLRRKGALNVIGLRGLASEPGHSALARLVLPRLLEGFPQRTSEAARRELNLSLLAALHLLDNDTASSVVCRKLDHPSIDAAQRLCWLAAALPYESDAARRLAKAVGRSERRAVALGTALHEQDSLGRTLKRVPPATLSQLIELLAPVTQPERPLGAHWVSPAHTRGDTVRALIDQLAGDPRPEATDELGRLSGLPRLASWATHFRRSLLSQKDVAREAYYAHPEPVVAALTLANGAPANRADLKALALDHLGDIHRHLRGADTFMLRQYWMTNVQGASVPKAENDCRDLLLDRLRDRLTPLGVLVVPERLAADDKRADLRVELVVAGRNMAVPIEIKKDSHKAVWTAWRDQLDRLYAIDPAADGQGIYLVLWFGYESRPSPEGEKPSSAAALEERLTERVPVQDRNRLVVRVLDFSLPPGEKRRRPMTKRADVGKPHSLLRAQRRIRT